MPGSMSFFASNVSVVVFISFALVAWVTSTATGCGCSSRLGDSSNWGSVGHDDVRIRKRDELSRKRTRLRVNSPITDSGFVTLELRVYDTDIVMSPIHAGAS